MEEKNKKEEIEDIFVEIKKPSKTVLKGIVNRVSETFILAESKGNGYKIPMSKEFSKLRVGDEISFSL